MNSVLFWIHMILSPVFGVSQCHKMLTSTQGVSVSMFVLAATFTTIQTQLAISAYRRKPVWATMQVVIVYIVGVLCYTAMISIAFLKGSYVWGKYDTVAITSSIIGTALVVWIGCRHKLPWYDPIVKGWINVPVRVVPNLIMAYTIWLSGSAGVSGTFVYVFNTLSIIRIAQIVLTSIKLHDWDRNRIGLMIGEIANELSWLVVTVVWYVKL
jgi:hypothetical protein